MNEIKCSDGKPLLKNPFKFNIIAAVDDKYGIGREGKIPWSGTDIGSADLAKFKELTVGGTVIMGRKTFESIGKLLPNRINIVLSRDTEGSIGQNSDTPLVWVRSLEDALKHAEKHRSGASCWVIGGAEIYKLALVHPRLHEVRLHKIPGDFDCDVKFPIEMLQNENGSAAKSSGWYNLRQTKIILEYDVYEFHNLQEIAYLSLLHDLKLESTRPNRTGIPTHGLFAQSLTFQLRDCRGPIMPLLTTKRVFWKSVYHELIWFLRGSTDIKYLTDNNVHIWDANSTREFLDGRGLTDYKPGEVGPVYGKQWRDWTSEDRHHDQLAEVIATIKKDPGNRRLIVSAWNVDQIDKMCLPACHFVYQFYVGFKDGEPFDLSCLVNMRSADVFLGVPFNIASYALLTHMVAHLTGLRPGTLVIMMADCHLYSNAISAVNKQLDRSPLRFPTFALSERTTSAQSIDDFAYKFSIDDYILNYESYPAIKCEMAI